MSEELKAGKNMKMTIDSNLYVNDVPIDEIISTAKTVGFSLTIAKHYEWEPEKDITTYELAICLPIVSAMQHTGSFVHDWSNVIDDLEENCKRHFKIVEV